MAAKVKKEKKANAGESSRDQSEQSADSRKDSRQSENRRSFPVEQSLELWDAFLSRWPIERLERMTLPEYTAVGSRDSFTYWIEIKLESLGNIFGSNSFKFGIFHRKSNAARESHRGRIFGKDYAWLSKLGATPQAAFESVRDAVASVAQAARAGNLEAIDKESRLSSNFKWKIAFLYQDQNRPTCPAVYSDELLKKAAGASSGATHLEAIKALMSDYDERENIFVFSKRVWESVQDGKEKTARRNVSASPSSQTTEAAHVEHLRPCWWLAANPKHWQFSRAAVGEDFPYTIISESGHKRQIFQNFLDAQAGDAVICYETTPTKKIQALAVVARPQNGQEIYFRKTTDLAAPIALEKLKGIKSLSNMEFFRRAQGTLFRLTPEEYGVIRGLIEDKKSDGLPAALEAACSKYSDDDFLHEVWLSAESLRRLKSLLERRKNLILQGPPGVGKTYAAKRLAWAMMGEKDDSRIAMVQFHQNYAYEDFIQGYKPDADGFSMKSGVFLDFCRKAGEDPQKRPHFFIIDEINRGNLSKIFGELMMLIEADHRGESLLLPATGEPFVVPENLYLIGMMNTADRSLAIIDYALRRRFSFVTMEPEFDSEGFRQLRSKVRNLLSEAGVQESIFEDLTSTIKSLNKAIKEDPALGKGFQIGHSYLSGVPLEGHSSPSWLDEFRDWLHEVVEYDLITLLEEYWFDNERALNDWSGVLRAAAGRLDARAS